MALLEFCIENNHYLTEALQHDQVKRLELCDNLAVGGTTVSFAMAEHVCQEAFSVNKEVLVMIRPRGGSFLYSPIEQAIMLRDMELLKSIHGLTGFVFGALTAENQLDKAFLLQLITASRPQKIAFHMAFDYIPKKDQLESLDWLIEQQVDHLLLHGSPNNNPIEENHAHLSSLIKHANQKIHITLGKGVRYEMLPHLTALFPTAQFHGTKIIPLPS